MSLEVYDIVSKNFDAENYCSRKGHTFLKSATVPYDKDNHIVLIARSIGKEISHLIMGTVSKKDLYSFSEEDIVPISTRKRLDTNRFLTRSGLNNSIKDQKGNEIKIEKYFINNELEAEGITRGPGSLMARIPG